MTHTSAVPTNRRAWLKRWAIEVSGWLLVIIGLVALVLPRPGLLLVSAGLVLLAMRYIWAARLLRPVKSRAFALATTGVQTWQRIVLSRGSHRAAGRRRGRARRSRG